MFVDANLTVAAIKNAYAAARVIVAVKFAK